MSSPARAAPSSRTQLQIRHERIYCWSALAWDGIGLHAAHRARSMCRLSGTASRSRAEQSATSRMSAAPAADAGGMASRLAVAASCPPGVGTAFRTSHDQLRALTPSGSSPVGAASPTVVAVTSAYITMHVVDMSGHVTYFLSQAASCLLMWCQTYPPLPDVQRTAVYTQQLGGGDHHDRRSMSCLPPAEGWFRGISF